MRQTTVFITDHVTSRRDGLAFSEEDFAMVDRQWDVEQEQLLALQDIDVFADKTRFSQLATEHFRALIQQGLAHYAKLTDDERADASHPTVRLVHFLTLAMIHRMETDTGQRIELMRINRISEFNITFDISATMDMNFIKPTVAKPQVATPAFTVVVDNTK